MTPARSSSAAWHRTWHLWRIRGLLWLNRQDQALDRLDEALGLWPQDRQLMASRAHLLAQQGRRTDALAQCNALVATGRAHAADWFNRGFLQENLGQLEGAEHSFRQALALNPAMDGAWYGLGLVLIRQERLDEALQALQRTAELQPLGPHAWYQMARIHTELRRVDEAVRIIRHLRGFEPKVADQLQRETGLAP
jgi:tetratricopeptide (TPR) repeat protein